MTSKAQRLLRIQKEKSRSQELWSTSTSNLIMVRRRLLLASIQPISLIPNSHSILLGTIKTRLFTFGIENLHKLKMLFLEDDLQDTNTTTWTKRLQMHCLLLGPSSINSEEENYDPLPIGVHC